MAAVVAHRKGDAMPSDLELIDGIDPTYGNYGNCAAQPSANPAQGVIRQIIEDALNSAIPEPWEVAEHATQRILAVIGAGGQAVAYDIEKQAWECDKWPDWLHAIVDRTNEAADRLDMSSEQAHAYAALSAIAHPVQRREQCATDGCGKPASVHFIRGGIGSYYCHGCYLKVQALPAAPQQKGE